MARGDGRYKQWMGCERKTRYPDEHTAARRAKRIGLRAYECPHCNGWHLTHVPPSHSAEPRYYNKPFVPSVSDTARLGMQLLEAQRILERLLALQKKGMELPPTVLDEARMRVREAHEAFDKARATK